ncbi:MAG: glycosyltransferase 87 family protein [Chloroflexota bacterium]
MFWSPTAGGAIWARRDRRAALIVAAAILGGILLAVVAVTAWPTFSDEHAYWTAAQRLAAGQPLYDAAAPTNQPYAYWYPPVLAQVLAPFTSVVSASAFTFFWTVLLIGCLWLLSGRDVVLTLAFIAFLPVALELRVRNIHLVVAVLMVLALRRSWVFWIPAAALKMAPALGVVYLLAAGRKREAALVAGVGGLIATASYALAPEAWGSFVAIASERAGADTSGVVGLPYEFRLLAGGLLALLAGRRGGRAGEIWVIVAITLANPTLWVNALSLLVAVVPLTRDANSFRRRLRVPSGDRAVIAARS